MTRQLIGEVDSPIDVWLRFDNDSDEEAVAEANTFKTEFGFRVDWYLNSVGLVQSVEFTDYDEAVSWLENQGFQDFSN